MTEPGSVAKHGASANRRSRPAHRSALRSAPSRPGQFVLVLSAVGAPLTQLAICRLGRKGAIVVEAVCAGLLVRDAALIALGAPRRLRRAPAILLWLEAGGAVAATALSLPLLYDPGALERARAGRATGPEAARRLAIGALFALHTLRFRIYLRPDRGRRARHVG